MGRAKAKRKAKPTVPERAISIDLAGGRWLMASQGLALNRTNSFARATKTLIQCDPVDIVPVDDLALLAQTLENAVRRKWLELPPITSWKDHEPGPIAIAAGFKTWSAYVHSGARNFAIDVMATQTEITESRVEGGGFSITKDDPSTVLEGPPDFAAIAEALRKAARKRAPKQKPRLRPKRRR